MRPGAHCETDSHRLFPIQSKKEWASAARQRVKNFSCEVDLT
jgi:hypothetical protein